MKARHCKSILLTATDINYIQIKPFKCCLRVVAAKMMALALWLMCFLMLPGTVPQWPWHTDWALGLASAIALISVNACIMSNRKSRFIALTTTLQIALMPFYIGIFLAVISPSVTVPLVFCCVALRLLLRFYCASLQTVEVLYSAAATRSRKRLYMTAYIYKGLETVQG